MLPLIDSWTDKQIQPRRLQQQPSNAIFTNTIPSTVCLFTNRSLSLFPSSLPPFLLSKDPLSALQTNRAYLENAILFRNHAESWQNNGRTKRRAVVLDLFSGIGGGFVALKRLGISLKRLIIVEQDKVAQHVLRHHHDLCYNFDPDALSGMTDDDSMEFVTIPTFEELQAELDGNNDGAEFTWLQDEE